MGPKSLGFTRHLTDRGVLMFQMMLHGAIIWQGRGLMNIMMILQMLTNYLLLRGFLRKLFKSNLCNFKRSVVSNQILSLQESAS